MFKWKASHVTIITKVFAHHDSDLMQLGRCEYLSFPLEIYLINMILYVSSFDLEKLIIDHLFKRNKINKQFSDVFVAKFSKAIFNSLWFFFCALGAYYEVIDVNFAVLNDRQKLPKAKLRL